MKELLSYFLKYKSSKILRKTLNFYSQFLKPGDLCFDVGANMGEKTTLFLKLHVKVVAIEPQPLCIQKLNSMFKNNKNVFIEEKALSDKEGNGVLKICEDTSTISTMSNKWMTLGRFSSDYKWTKKVEIKTTTLNKLIEFYGTPAFCKIDVEGFELQVLKGLSQPIKYISFEFTQEFIKDAWLCLDHLQHLGYKKFNFAIDDNMHFYLPEWVTHKILISELKKINTNLYWGDIYGKYE